MPRTKLPRITPAKFARVIRDFETSEKFTALAPKTQVSYRHVLRLAEHPSTLGEIPVDEIDPYLVQAFVDSFAKRPGIQRHALVALRSLERWAVKRRFLPRSITFGVETVEMDGAREPWTESEVAVAEKHARPDLARVVTLAVNCGQRIGDLCALKWSAFRTYRGHAGIDLTQQKTDKRLWVPFTSELEAALATWERKSIFVLTAAKGGPWTRPLLSNEWWLERRKNEALAPLEARKLSLHGLRATAVIRLRRAGVSRPLIADMVGMSTAMVDRYCRRSEQADNALAALEMLQSQAGKIVPFKRSVP